MFNSFKYFFDLTVFIGELGDIYTLEGKDKAFRQHGWANTFFIFTKNEILLPKGIDRVIIPPHNNGDFDYVFDKEQTVAYRLQKLSKYDRRIPHDCSFYVLYKFKGALSDKENKLCLLLVV